MADFQPPPTWAEVILVDENTQKPKFNPVWLKWFVDLAGVLNASGGTALDHNMLSNLQGGTANQFYHLTSAQASGLATHSDKLSAFAATTSTELAGVISDETGSGKLMFSNGPVLDGPIRLKGYTVATLPAGTQGNVAFVTDALAPAFLTAIAGGGAIVTPVFYDGTNWIAF